MTKRPLAASVAALICAAAFSGVAAAANTDSTAGYTPSSVLPVDEPAALGNGVTVACTGISSEARADPRWAAFPLKVEVAGYGGQYLAGATIEISSGAQTIASVRCNTPWALFQLNPGKYRLSATSEGQTTAVTAAVPARGQAKITLRFPQQGGPISPEAAPVS